MKVGIDVDNDGKVDVEIDLGKLRRRLFALWTMIGGGALCATSWLVL